MARLPTAAEVTMAGLVGACSAATNATLSMTQPIWGRFLADSNFLKKRFVRESQNLVESSVFSAVTGFGGSLLATSVKQPLLGL